MADDLIIDLGFDGMADMVRDINEVAKGIQESVGPIRELRYQLKFAAQNMRKLADETRRFFLFTHATSAALKQMQTAMPATAGFNPNQRGSWNQQWLMGQIGQASAPAPAARVPRPRIPPTFGQQFMRALNTSRFSFGANGFSMMPLIGQTLRAFGSAAGPIGLTVTAIGALAKAAWDGAKRINELNAERWGAGGTFKDAEVARKVAASLGLDAKDLMGGAHGLAGKLGSDSYAMMFGMKAGVSNPLGGTPFGNANELRDYIKAARAIATTPNDVEAIRMARALGMENILPMRELPMDEIKKRFSNAEGGFNSADAKRAAEAQKRYGDFQLGWEKGKGEAFNSFMGKSKDNPFGGPASTNADFFRGKTGDLKKLSDSIRAQDEQSKAVRDNTAALESHAMVLKNLGLHGGGERARGAIPRGLLGSMPYQQNEALRQGLRLGAFAL